MNHTEDQYHYQLTNEAITALEALADQPPVQQEPVACIHKGYLYMVHEFQSGQCPIDSQPLYTSPPQRKPLTHEQRVDLLAKFEAHKHEWHAPAILIDMVEAAHGIGEKK